MQAQAAEATVAIKSKAAERRQISPAKIKELKQLRKKAKEMEDYLSNKQRQDELVEKSCK